MSEELLIQQLAASRTQTAMLHTALRKAKALLHGKSFSVEEAPHAARVIAEIDAALSASEPEIQRRDERLAKAAREVIKASRDYADIDLEKAIDELEKELT